MNSVSANYKFNGKVVLVTGAAGGIGLATAKRFAAEGATVIAMDLPGSPLSKALGDLGELPGELHQVEGDVGNAGDWRTTIDHAVSHFGGVDILVNNAGIVEVGTRLEDFEESAFERVMAVNVRGPFLGMKSVVPTMRHRGGGAIVNVASISSFLGAAKAIAYTASKHALLGMTKSAAADLAEYGIRVNAVCPSPIDTPMVRNMEKRVLSQDPNFDVTVAMTGGILMKRLGTAQEVAAAIVFLASDEASFMTGAAVAVDGGALAT